ncbi:amino acid adenylation domain-containing protein [Aquimarina rhabdastrellae]
MKTQLILNIVQEAQQHKIQLFAKGGRLGMKKKKTDTIPAALLKQIKENEQELIHFFENQIKAKPTISPITKSIHRPEQITPSFAQERLWFIDRLQGSLQYHIPGVLKITGAIDTQALSESLQYIIERHEALRTVFEEIDGKVYQKVIPSQSFQISYQEAAYDTVMNTLLKDLMTAPFDLASDYMLRADLITVAPNAHVFILVAHHIASDGWSLPILVKELEQLYNAKIQQKELALPDLPVQYIDYSIWQKETLQGDVLEEKLKFWQQQLQGVEPLELPTDYQRSAVQTSNGTSYLFSLDKQQTEGLKQLTQQYETTLFMCLLSMYKVLLYRYSGNQDICVGSPVANREQLEIAPLIGFFVNMIAIRSQVEGTQSFESLLKQVKETTLEAYKYQDVPFEKVVDRVVQTRDQSRTPVFQTMLTYQNNEQVNQVTLGESTIEMIDIPSSSAKFDISLNITEAKGEIFISVEYNTDLFKPESIERLGAHFQYLVAAILNNPKEKIDQLKILSEAEKAQIAGFNATPIAYPEVGNLLEEFAKQVASRPEATAVVFEGESLSFEALDQKTNQLANYLRKQGVTKETLVPINVERSFEMLIGILGILKAGGAYVPIDPMFPADRIGYILEDTAAKIVLTQERFVTQFEDKEIQAIALDTLTLEEESKEFEAATIAPEQLAYVIYTSGTTGRPKGVLCEHQGLRNRLKWMQDDLSITTEDIIIQKTTYTFDVSVWELTMPLVTGCKLVFAKPEGHKDPLYLQELIAKEQGTIMHFVPSMLSIFLEDVDSKLCTSLRHVVCSGEALTSSMVKSFKTQLPTIQIHNLYGPTEAAIDVTAIDLTTAEIENQVSIGYPVANTQIHILNDALEPQPIGVAGELCIGGIQVARGYLNREDLTKEKFLEDPFNSGGRLYKTGDLASWNADGSIAYIGRKDNQVKLRGYRIELGEIEALLEEQDTVQQAVVVAKGITPGNKQLVAYVVNEGVFEEQAAMEQLSTLLPEYMVPKYYVSLTEMPLSGNGKVDRKRLPSPAVGSSNQEAYVAPATDTEKALAAIWQELLGVAQVGKNDNFFEIGGHSLLAVKLVSRIRTTFSVAPSVKVIFEKDTLAQLAAYIDTAEVSILPTITKVERPDYIPLSFTQERLWFIDQLQGSVAYHMPAILKLEGTLDIAILQQAIKAIVWRHEVLRTVIKEHEGKGYQHILDGDHFEIQQTTLQAIEKESSLTDFTQKEIAKPFQLASDYMLRVTLVALSETTYQLILVMHHIASDGWSIPIFVKELEELYQAIANETSHRLAPLEMQYADYSIWQRTHLTGALLDQKLNYWEEKLKETTPLAMPLDFPRQAEQQNDGAVFRFELPEGTTQALKDISTAQRSTLFMTLLSVYKILLYRYTGENDITVGSPIANREQAEIADLIGFFVNTIALRSQIEGSQNFDTILKQVKTATLEAYANQDVPFEKIVERVEGERSQDRTPIFQTLLTLQNNEEVEGLRLGESTISITPFEQQTAKFEMSLDIVEINNTLGITIEYNTNLFKFTTIERFAKHFEQITAAIIKDQNVSVEKLQLIGSEEQQLLVERFNTDTLSLKDEEHVIALLEKQVKATPNAIALRYQDIAITYQEVEDRSNQLAHYILKQGIPQQNMIPLVIDRSLDTIIAIIAILKTGSAYVPIDSKYPQERIDYILKDIHARIAITKTSKASVFEAHEEIQLLLLDTLTEKIAAQPVAAIPQEYTTAAIAYVIYTSGTTGQPKGTLVPHSGISRLSKMDHLPLNEQTTILQLSTISFDAATFEIWCSLLNGGTLALYSSDTVDLPTINAEIIKHQVNTIWLTSALFDQWVQSDLSEMSLQYVLSGGDVLTPSSIQLLYQKLPEVTLINGYGPTENTTFTCCYTVPRDFNFDQAIPIGSPIQGTQVYVLDEALQPCPIGVAGELYTSGYGLAAGYLNQKNTTEEKFIKHPFQPNEKLYKTGDIVRWLADGNIAFIGRKDNQIKIRGFRIELGEIETAITQLSEVQQAVVLVKEDTAANKQLVGYIVSEKAITQEEIVTQLQKRLPAYMIPKWFVMLEEFPITANGKVDRRALPEPTIEALSEENYVAPSTEIEEKLVAVYEGLLGIEKVSVTANFFELGGDSIKAIQVVSRAKAAGVLITVKDIFTYQTIRELAQHTKADLIIQKEEGILSGTAGLLPIQQWFFEQELEAVSHYNQSVLLNINKEVSEANLAIAIQTLGAQHDVLRFLYAQEDHITQTYTNQKLNLVTEECLSVEAVESCCEKYQRDLSIYDGDLVRFVKITTAENEAYDKLFLAIHHLAIDGVSWRILLEDLHQILAQLQNNEAVSLAAKMSSYRQWQQELVEYASSETLQGELKYWKNTVKDIQALPQDKTTETVCTQNEVKEYVVQIEESKTQALLQEVHHAYHTEMNDILLSALTLTLTEWMDTDKVTIGLEGHGREMITEDIDISRTIGWFTTLYPVQLAIRNDEKELESVIANTKDMLRAIPNKGIGYGVLRYLSNEATKQELTADFEQIIFNYLGSFDNTLPTNDLLSIATENKGKDVSVQNKVHNKIAINSMIAQGVLRCTWSYDSTRYNEETIVALAQKFEQSLQEIIAHCKAIKEPLTTVSEYGLPSTISYKQLAKFKFEESHETAIEDIYPLSPLQEGMLFHSLFDTQKDAYLIQFGCDFVGDFDSVAFNRSWQTLVEKHAILRTKIYHNVFSSAIQCVYKEVAIPIERLDFSAYEGDVLDEKIATFLASDKERGFSIDEFPLIRISLIQLGENRIKMILSNHHILWDGWSLSMMMSSFMQYYQTYSEGKEITIETKDNYGDQVRWIQQKGIHQGISFWKEYISEIETPSYLSFIKDTTQRNTLMGNTTHYVSIAKEDTQNIEAFAKANRITVNTVVQGAWAYLLSRYSSQNEVVFGATVSGRDSAIEGVENRIGLYINTIPVCTQIDEQQSIADWLQELQKGHTIGREEFNYVPLGKIQAASGVREALFDTLLVFENYPIDENSLGTNEGIQIENIYNHEQTNYVLSISFSLVQEQLSMKFMYNDTLIDKAQIETIEAQLKTVLSQFIGTAETLEELSYLTAAEHRLVTETFNQTYLELPQDTTVLDIFKKQVDQNPLAIAVIHEEIQLTYKELDEKSNQLAHYLLQQGVQAEDLIPICVERSVDMLVGILGILKTGAAYVPIDPNYPQERIDFILKDTASSHLIIQSAVQELFVTNTTYQIYDVNILETTISEMPTTAVGVEVSKEQLAYIIYTSGTTGIPKGVMIQHKSLHALLTTMNQKYPVTSEDRLLLKTTFSFDVSVYELFGWMYQGGSLGILPKGYEADLPALVQTIETLKITHFNLVPSLFSVFVAALPALGVKRVDCLKYVMLAGEKLPLELVLNYRKLGLKATLENIYGPTEATIYTSYYDTTPLSPEVVNVPIGKPFDNINLYVLNEQLQPQAVGVKGELCISGIQLAKGYWNRPKLTAEKFVPNPFKKGERLYKTGDVVQWLADGTIEYIGRKDNQVKIRGYRIELGEIEIKLNRLDPIQQSLVTVYEDATGEQRLLAYVVTEEAIENKEIEALLTAQLPVYMVPKLYVQLTEFPLTPNGKINRKALPEPSTEAITQQEYVAPETPIEEKLVAIWEELLTISPIGINDNFFEIGGHSLLAVRLIPLLHEAFELEINVRELFEYPTISSLSKYIALNIEEEEGEDESAYDVYSL